MAKKLLALGTLAAGLAIGSSFFLTAAEAPPANLGKKVSAFILNDPREGKQVGLADFKEKKAIVLLFLGTECPINNAFLPCLAHLHKEYSFKGVQFLGINSNCLDSPERVAEHAKKYGIPFPVLKDTQNAVADLVGARRTPEAILLDGGGIIRYQGRIDDQFGIGYQRPKPTRRDLAEAIDEVLAGKEVSQPAISVAGCAIARAAKPKNDGPITWSNQVARIVQNNCQECHRPGQIGPMPLLTYDDAAAWSQTIREVVSDKRMPPWYADPQHGKFANDRRLPKKESDTLLAWIDAGCSKGDPRDQPPAREWPEGWRIGKPDVVLTMPQEYDVPAEAPRGGIPYKHFVIDPGFQEDRWVTHLEAKAGAPSVVHHILMFVLPPGMRFNKDNPNNIVLGGTAPGDMPAVLPAGMAKRIPAGSKLILQMHYTPNGQAQKDRSSIALIFAKEEPKYEVRTLPVYNFLFRIPPGDDNYKVESSYTFSRDGQLISFMPHMHLRGKDFLYEAVQPDGKSETLLSVPRFNFNWQNVYRVAEPVPMPKGSKLHCIAHFDNSTKNLNNPDPTKTVYWGDQTWQEMMVGWMDVAWERTKE